MYTRACFIAALMAGACFAQSDAAKTPERKFYHLDFVVKELDAGKVVNSRAYAMTASTLDRTSVRTGNRLPVQTKQPTNNPSNASFTYVDVGTNIDCSDVKEVENQLTLYVGAEISSAASQADAPAPVIRQVRWNSRVILPLRKPTVIFSSDDPTSKRQMQLELTATVVK